LQVDLGVGVGFDDADSPWGNENIGKASTVGGFNNIRIPFQKSIRITAQQDKDTPEGLLWFIIRGAEGAPVTIGDMLLPSTAKLVLYKNNNVTLNPLQFINVVDVQSRGALYMVTLAAASSNLNFLEGCFRAVIDSRPQFLMSSGTEDYFDSAYYFNAGRFALDESGFTHEATNTGAFGTQISAYRFHTMDYVVWTNSFQLIWRNGDTYSPINKQKCVDDTGPVVGNPGVSHVITYAWVYHY